MAKHTGSNKRAPSR